MSELNLYLEFNLGVIHLLYLPLALLDSCGKLPEVIWYLLLFRCYEVSILLSNTLFDAAELVFHQEILVFA